MDDERRRIGRRVQEVRKLRRRSAAFIAHILDVSEQIVKNWEAGRTDIGDRLPDLARALEADVSDLIAPLGSPIRWRNNKPRQQPYFPIPFDVLGWTCCGAIIGWMC